MDKNYKKMTPERVLYMKLKFRKLIQAILLVSIIPLPSFADEDPCEGSYCDQNPTAEECLQCPERPGCPGGDDGGDHMDIALSE